MKKGQFLLDQNNLYESNHLPIFIMILRSLLKSGYKFDKYELNIINKLLEEILGFEEDKKIINFGLFSPNLSLIERLSKSNDNIKSDNNKEFESFLDYTISSEYFIFKLDYNSERKSYEVSELENKLISKNLDYGHTRLIKEDKNYDFWMVYNDDLSIDIEKIARGDSNFAITYAQISSINQKDFYDRYELENIDIKEIEYSTKDLVNERILENNNANIEFNTIINNYSNELIINIAIDSNNKKILIQDIDLDNKTEEFKIESANIQNHEENDIYSQNTFYYNSGKENSKNLFFDSFSFKEVEDFSEISFGNRNYSKFSIYNFKDKIISYDSDRIVYEKKVDKIKEIKNEIYSNRDFESEITPCLDIDFCPERIDNKKYSLFGGGLELKVNEHDSKAGAVFGITDKNTNSGKFYNTNANEISALIFKALEEKGVFADFEFSDGKIYLKDVNGTRMFIEDNQNISVKNISYKVVLRDNKTKEEIKNFNLNDKLNPGNYTIDIFAEVDYGRKFSNNFDGRSNKSLENNSPDFNVMIRNDRKIRAYCIDECGFETNGKDSILNQIIKVSENNGYSLELETMDTIANNKIRARSVTYIKDIVGTKEKYLELHPTAKENKIGILYLVFDENDKVLGEVGYRDEGLNYVARKGLKIKPVIYELGANIKDAYVWNKVPEHPKKFSSKIFSDAKINNAV